ncbi:hypothetical protein [uncultured Cohaesibacter sp.]|uniref:hypothetical protein n=1 Tax=uncultured Cohaesibacter sp. TaxID=1002546 RepID=UPI0029C8807E|nr:hypothetical protein [uncultured Cohaesibacter sp.]
MAKVDDKNKTKRIEVFRPGTFTAMGGMAFSASAEDLAGLAQRYDPDAYPVPVVVGHPKTDDPAYGWVKAFSYDDEADRLFAEIGDLEPQFADAVAQHRYKRVSMAFYKPGASSNPAGDALYPKHVGFLGAVAPAVPGLKPVEFAGDADDVVAVEFADAAFKDVASIFRRFRDWLIANEGLETADNVLPDYQIRWIDDAGDLPPDIPSPEFSEDEEPTMALKPAKSKPSQTASTQPSEAELAFAEREAELNARQAELDEREAEQRHETHVAFAEGLVDDGRLPSGNRVKVVALLDGASELDADEIEFADGDETKKADLVELLKDVLKTQPPIIQFGEMDLGDAPDGKEPDPEVIANEAIAFQVSQREAGIEVSTSDAISHIRQKRGLTD